MWSMKIPSIGMTHFLIWSPCNAPIQANNMGHPPSRLGFQGLYLQQNTISYLMVLTLTEAQRTQGIESISWVNLSARIVQNQFQWYFLDWLQIWPPSENWIRKKTVLLHTQEFSRSRRQRRRPKSYWRSITSWTSVSCCKYVLDSLFLSSCVDVMSD